MFIIEMRTKDGTFCESYPTYEEALQRVNSIPEENLRGIPFLFQELPDGSQRLIREDGKPLQWHRLPEDPLPGSDEVIPLSEEVLTPTKSSEPEWDEEPLPLCEEVLGDGKIRVVWIKEESEEGTGDKT